MRAPEPRRTLKGALAAFAVRRTAGLLHWKAQREARAASRTAGPPGEQQFRGFVQINLIRMER